MQIGCLKRAKGVPSHGQTGVAVAPWQAFTIFGRAGYLGPCMNLAGPQAGTRSNGQARGLTCQMIHFLEAHSNVCTGWMDVSQAVGLGPAYVLSCEPRGRPQDAGLPEAAE